MWYDTNYTVWIPRQLLSHCYRRRINDIFIGPVLSVFAYLAVSVVPHLIISSQHLAILHGQYFFHLTKYLLIWVSAMLCNWGDWNNQFTCEFKQWYPILQQRWSAPCILVACICSGHSVTQLKHPSQGWLHIFNSLPLADAAVYASAKSAHATEHFCFSRRNYKRWIISLFIYRSLKMYWMTFRWHWQRLMTMILINTMFVCIIQPLVQPIQTVMVPKSP